MTYRDDERDERDDQDERGNSQDEAEDVIVRPEPQDRIQWIGSNKHPNAAEKDGISDLFDSGSELEEEDVDELTEVDFEADILDAGEDGTLEDLTSVSSEDVIGRAPPRRRRASKRTFIRPPDSPGLGSFR